MAQRLLWEGLQTPKAAENGVARLLINMLTLGRTPIPAIPCAASGGVRRITSHLYQGFRIS